MRQGWQAAGLPARACQWGACDNLQRSVNQAAQQTLGPGQPVTDSESAAAFLDFMWCGQTIVVFCWLANTVGVRFRQSLLT